jgi:hypothetical protein
MKTYHGTSNSISNEILIKGVDFSKGGGELGQGFYVGDLLHQACAWAWNKYKKEYSVLVFNLNDEDFLKLNIDVLDSEQASRLRCRLRAEKKQHTYIRGVDAIWSPVVGKRIPNFNQIKFESSSREFIKSTNKEKWKM